MTKTPRTRRSLVVYLVIAVAVWALVEGINSSDTTDVAVEPPTPAVEAPLAESGDDAAAPATATTKPTRTRVATKTPRRRRTATPQSLPATDLEHLRASSGFVVGSDGFSFENYGNEPGIRNLKTAEMRRMFGDVVCSRVKNDVCTLSPAARQWMREINNAMDGGHCEGMAVLSQHLYHRLVDRDGLGRGSTASLDLYSNDALQAEIAYWWATQMTAPTTNAMQYGTPAQIVETLSTWMQSSDPAHVYTIGIYKRDWTGGHAIAPVAIEPIDDRYVDIMVYDNNYPNEVRAIRVDMQANRWSYEGSPNPAYESDLYEGDAETLTLELTPSEPRLLRQECDFCNGPKSKTGGKGATIFLLHDVTATDSGAEVQSLFVTPDGRRIGYLDGEFINEIAGATVTVVKSAPTVWEGRGTPLITIPANETVSLQMQSSDADTFAVTAFSDGRVVHIDDLLVADDQTDIGFAAGLDTLTLDSANEDDADIYFGDVVDDTDTAYSTQLTDFDLAADQPVTFAYDETDGTFVISGNDDGVYDLDIISSDADGDVAFSIDDVATIDESAFTFDLDTIDDEGESLAYEVDTTGDGAFEEALSLSDDDLSIDAGDFAAEDLEWYVDESYSNL